MSTISPDFKCGKNLTIGDYVIVEPDVIVGENVKIGHRVTLKSGTVIGNDSIIDDHCITTGACYIGNHVNIRTGAIISKATIIEDYGFIGPGVITNHTKNVIHGRSNVPDIQLITYVGFGSIIGSQASILAGISIAPHVIIGGGAVVVKHLDISGVYVGSPAIKVAEVGQEYLMDEPEKAGFMYLNDEVLNPIYSYIPNLKVTSNYIELSPHLD